MIASGEVPRGEKMLYSGTVPESYITDYTLVYEDKPKIIGGGADGSKRFFYGIVTRGAHLHLTHHP